MVSADVHVVGVDWWRRNIPKMEQIEDAVGVHPHRSPDGRVVGPEADGVHNARRRRRHALGLPGGKAILEGRLANLGATDALGNVDAGLGGVAGLTRIDDVVGVLVSTIRIGALPLRRVGGSRVRVGLAVAKGGGFGSGAVALFARGIA